MKRSLLAITGLVLTTLVIGCSGGGSGGGAKKNDKGGAPAQGGGALPQGATRPKTMTANAWCMNGQDQQTGAAAQQRISLQDDGGFVVTNYELDQAGARGKETLRLEGTWYVENNNTLAFTIKGQQEQKAQLRVDPNGPAGAPQMTIGQDAYDPCN